MIFDYSNPENYETIQQLFESLPESEKRQLFTYAQELKETHDDHRKKRYLEWVMEAVIPALKRLAELTCSVLEVEPAEDTIYAKLKSLHNLEITGAEYLGILRLVVGVADCFEIRKDEDQLQILFAYSVPADSSLY